MTIICMTYLREILMTLVMDDYYNTCTLYLAYIYLYPSRPQFIMVTLPHFKDHRKHVHFYTIIIYYTVVIMNQI